MRGTLRDSGGDRSLWSRCVAPSEPCRHARAHEMTFLCAGAPIRVSPPLRSSIGLSPQSRGFARSRPKRQENEPLPHESRIDRVVRVAFRRKYLLARKSTLGCRAAKGELGGGRCGAYVPAPRPNRCGIGRAAGRGPGGSNGGPTVRGGPARTGEARFARAIRHRGSRGPRRGLVSEPEGSDIGPHPSDPRPADTTGACSSPSFVRSAVPDRNRFGPTGPWRSALVAPRSARVPAWRTRCSRRQ